MSNHDLQSKSSKEDNLDNTLVKDETKTELSLVDLINFNDSEIKSIQETYSILSMAGSDLVKLSNGINSARKLRKLMMNVLSKNLELHSAVSQKAVKALEMNNKLLKIVQSKDPRKEVSE
jgi:hypothetical protein